MARWALQGGFWIKEWLARRNKCAVQEREGLAVNDRCPSDGKGGHPKETAALHQPRGSVQPHMPVGNHPGARVGRVRHLPYGRPTSTIRVPVGNHTGAGNQNDGWPSAATPVPVGNETG